MDNSFRLPWPWRTVVRRLWFCSVLREHFTIVFLGPVQSVETWRSQAFVWKRRHRSRVRIVFNFGVPSLLINNEIKIFRTLDTYTLYRKESYVVRGP